MGSHCLASLGTIIGSYYHYYHLRGAGLCILAAGCRDLLRARFLRACAQEGQRVQSVGAHMLVGTVFKLGILRWVLIA